MNDERPIDLSPMRAELSARADRVAARALARIAESRSLPLEFRRTLAHWAIPAALAAAASMAWLLASRPVARQPDLQRLLTTDRPVPMLELMIVMEEDVR